MFHRRYQAKITGAISCFDRILFRGHLPLGWPDAMERFIARRGLPIKDFAPFVSRQSERIKDHAKAMAHRTGRPYIHPSSPIRKEEQAQAIALGDRITKGLVCILAVVEARRSFKMAYGHRRPKIVSARRKCLCLCFYFVDPQFGFLQVRITSWYPFTVHPQRPCDGDCHHAPASPTLPAAPHPPSCLRSKNVCVKRAELRPKRAQPSRLKRIAPIIGPFYLGCHIELPPPHLIS